MIDINQILRSQETKEDNPDYAFHAAREAAVQAIKGIENNIIHLLVLSDNEESWATTQIKKYIQELNDQTPKK